MIIQEKLLPINCHYNFKVEDDGKCHSKTCMLNVDPEIMMKIESEGCIIFSHVKKIGRTYVLV